MLNEKAPNFNLKDKDGIEHELDKIKSDYTILYFYPKDNTGGCTLEAIGFTKNLEAFDKIKTKVIGISGGDEKSKTSFCKKHSLKVLLLSDPDFEISKKYQAYGEKKFMWRKFNGIHRKTYILDKNKKIIRVFDKVKPENHALEILEFLRTI